MERLCFCGPERGDNEDNCNMTIIIIMHYYNGNYSNIIMTTSSTKCLFMNSLHCIFNCPANSRLQIFYFLSINRDIEQIFFQHHRKVTDLSLMEKMDKTMFDAYFLDTRTWSHVLGDGSSVELKKDGENVTLQFEDRLEYIKLAKEARLHEFKAQVRS